MKKILSLALVFGAVVVAHAQGTFNPATYFSDPNFDHSGGTVIDSTAGNANVFGSGYSGQYYFGPAGTTDPNALTAVGPITGFMGASASDPTAGYYNGDGSGSVTVPGQAGGATVVLQLRAWKNSSGSTYATAGINGASALVSVVLGNAGSPATLPVSITTMPNFAVAGPEPATMALGLMGAGALFLRRRKA